MVGQGRRGLTRGIALGILLSLAAARDAHAYIDPGSGSYLFQILIAGVAGAAYAVKLFWRRLRPFFDVILQRRRQ